MSNQKSKVMSYFLLDLNLDEIAEKLALPLDPDVSDLDLSDSTDEETDLHRVGPLDTVDGNGDDSAWDTSDDVALGHGVFMNQPQQGRFGPQRWRHQSNFVPKDIVKDAEATNAVLPTVQKPMYNFQRYLDDRFFDILSVY